MSKLIYPIDFQQSNNKKPNCYLVEDQMWLCKCIDQCISIWCYKWLSINGRMKLVKSTLESIFLFQLSLSKVAKTTLGRIIQTMFKFSMARYKERYGFHLVKWETISWKKFNGVWGFKNFHWFGLAIAMKSIWRVLTSSGIQRTIVVDKYSNNQLVIDWIWSGMNLNYVGGSNIWIGLLHTIKLTIM